MAEDERGEDGETKRLSGEGGWPHVKVMAIKLAVG